MKPVHWIIIVIALLASLFSIRSCTSDGTTLDKTVAEPVYNFKCTACEEESEFTTSMLSDLKKSGRAEAISGQMLKVECPNCTKIKASLYEPYSAEELGN